VLSREELVTGYQNMMVQSTLEEVERVVDELIQNVGMNREGEINFTEFLVAAMNREKLLSSKQIEKAFKMFDDDGNGYIDLEELKMAMSGVKMSDEKWRNIITKYDVDGDGVVGLEILVSEFFRFRSRSSWRCLWAWLKHRDY
jgi:calcium-dependent protein kinase